MSDAIEVSHCGECPVHRYAREWIKQPGAFGGTYEANVERCGAVELDTSGRLIARDEPERPEWCPLDGGPITIRLREVRR